MKQLPNTKGGPGSVVSMGCQIEMLSVRKKMVSVLEFTLVPDYRRVYRVALRVALKMDTFTLSMKCNQSGILTGFSE